MKKKPRDIGEILCAALNRATQRKWELEQSLKKPERKLGGIGARFAAALTRALEEKDGKLAGQIANGAGDNESVGEWRERMILEGFSVPLPMCQGLAQTMKVLDLSFREALNLLVDQKKIFLFEKTFVFDLSWLEELEKLRKS